jgi:hypothetical protein
MAAGSLKGYSIEILQGFNIALMLKKQCLDKVELSESAGAAFGRFWKNRIGTSFLVTLW